MSEMDFAERNAGATAVRDIIRMAKATLDPEVYHKVCDGDLIPVFTKGLMIKHDRVQAEFIQILTEAMTDDGRLGTHTDLKNLQNVSRNEDETNLFDNMRHIQKHRRGRAMRRLIKEKDDISDLTCQKILLPMIRTYVFNPDYVQQAEIVTSAISAIGGLASKLSWRGYTKLLQQYLSQKPLEPAFQKQRVKVLASILDSFHFTDEATMKKAKQMLERLLRKSSTSGRSFFKDGVEENRAADLALYVPIMKILMLLPEQELNNHVSTLLVTVSAQLKSRRIEERQLARDILCQMSGLLGPVYLAHIITILKAQLQRGYQVHILVYTTHAVLGAMLAKHKATTEAGGIDVAIGPVMHMVNDELFANLMEEKKIAALVKKTAEAKKTVSYHMLELLATHMSKSMLASMLNSLLKSYMTSNNFEAGQKVNKAMRSILQGLLKNGQLVRTDLMQLGFGILSEKLLPNNHRSLDEFAFGLLHAASNPGNNESPLGPEDIRPLIIHMTKGIKSTLTSVM